MRGDGGGRAWILRGAFNAPSEGFASSLRCPVHLDGTASIGSHGRQGGEIWAGLGGLLSLLRAASPAVAGAEGEARLTPVSGGQGDRGGQQLVGAGNPTLVRLRTLVTRVHL